MRKLRIIGLVLLLTSLGANTAETSVSTADVERFLAIYNASDGRPSASVLQQEYIDAGSPGLRRFASIRDITGERIATSISMHPELFSDAVSCAQELPSITASVHEARNRLQKLLPRAQFPSVSIVVGRGRPVAVGEKAGVYIGLEALCAWKTPDPTFRTRAYHVIVHELVHTQQTGLAELDREMTVLEASLVEGAAEFLTEQASGRVAYRHLPDLVVGREFELEAAFMRDADKPASGSLWIFNEGLSKDTPSDLGYYIGYRIVKSYYLNSMDKRRAIKDVLEINNAKKFLMESGWRPGLLIL